MGVGGSSPLVSIRFQALNPSLVKTWGFIVWMYLDLIGHDWGCFTCKFACRLSLLQFRHLGAVDHVAIGF